MESFKRPPSVSFPKVWSKFNGKTKIDETFPQFWIQDIPDDMHEGVVQFMKKCFVPDEPLCKHIAPRDPNLIKSIAEFQRNVLKQKMSLGCFTKDPKDSKPVLVGVNLLALTKKDDKEKEGDLALKILNYVYKYKDPFETFGITEYLAGFGLGVLREYRGQNIGLELLKARLVMMKEFSIAMTMTIFTAKPSQILAKRIGFEDFVSLEYEEIWTNRPDLKVSGVSEDSKYCKFMYKFLE